MNKFLCLMGVHKWWYSMSRGKRVCKNCYKKQKETYDMCYGSSYYEDEM